VSVRLYETTTGTQAITEPILNLSVMRAAFIHPSFPSAEGTGATHSATQIVAGLSDAGHDLCVYCTQSPDERLEIDGAKLRHLDSNSSNPHTNTKLNKVITSRINEFDEYDIVHSYLPSLIPALERIGKQTSAGTVVTLNAYAGVCPKNDLLYLDREDCRDNSTGRCLRCLTQTSPGHEEFSAPYRIISRLGNLRLIRRGEKRLDQIDAFRAPSAHVKSNYVELGFPSDPIHVIPHPLDERFDIPHNSGFTEPYELLYVGYLEKHKGVEKLVPLMASLAESNVEFSLTIVGSGGLESTLHSQAEEHGVTDSIEFAGFVPNEDLPEIYTSHDCFVYPGIWDEPLARVYLEAFATGTPVVTSEYGNIAEIVGDAGRVTDGSVEGFRETLLDVVANGELEVMSAAAKDRAEAFRLSKVVKQIGGVYSTILE